MKKKKEKKSQINNIGYTESGLYFLTIETIQSSMLSIIIIIIIIIKHWSWSWKLGLGVYRVSSGSAATELLHLAEQHLVVAQGARGFGVQLQGQLVVPLGQLHPGPAVVQHG